MAILQTTITRENVHFQTSCCLAKLITRGGWTKNLVTSTLLGRCKLFLSGRETWNKSKKVPLKSSVASFLQYICRVEVQVQFLQFWLMSKVSHPLGEWFASILSQLLLVCRFCLCNWDKLSPIKGVSMQPFCYWFLPSTNKLARIKVSLVTDGCQASQTVSNPGRVSIFLVWNPLKPDQRLVLMYSLEQRMTACCLVFSGEFFTCTGCWRQPGSWERSQSLNDCTVMRKRRS